MEPLTDAEADDYLKHLGVVRSGQVNREYLDALIRAHLERVTFENLDVVLGRNIPLGPNAVLSKVMRRRRGGYCFELNSLFGRLLMTLGYQVKLRAARFLLMMPDHLHAKTRLSHMTLLVELPDGVSCIADVGMGFVGVHRALLLQGDASPCRVRTSISGSVEISLPTKNAGWKVFYLVEPYDLTWQDFESIKWYLSTKPDCALRHMVVVGRRSPVDGCWLQLVDDRFIRWSPVDGIVEKRVMRDADEILELLQTTFALRLCPKDDVEALRFRLSEVLRSSKLAEIALDGMNLWPE
ncbi:hypothetical protein HPB49_005885 [Dermacentor silvarum]|uniref:Uncharacterized protein n=1 Tax=Dermacentor silvarum TaxID=543639 RepID=A0ACB8C7H0_DERSI|nr:arylamine N-acetyltransferase / N-hydroxyarylamine O-acetyltransferase [Dermacentor silvarum]KAH7936863.1 hypothetical protein HPB49_005885 [Dermacentor silvarum]